MLRVGGSVPARPHFWLRVHWRWHLAVGCRVASLDYLMVDTCCPHPAAMAPEGLAYTLAYTAREVFRHVREELIV